MAPYDGIRKIYFDERVRSLAPNGKGVIKPGVEIRLSLKFATPGPFILEVNDESGAAIINQAIYVGDVFPLLPDYLDIKIQSLLDKGDTKAALEKYLKLYYPKILNSEEPLKKFSLEEKNNYLLMLLNLVRAKYIVNKVTLDERLTNLAQKHSEDMAKNKFFSHINLRSQGPE